MLGLRLRLSLFDVGVDEVVELKLWLVLEVGIEEVRELELWL